MQFFSERVFSLPPYSKKDSRKVARENSGKNLLILTPPLKRQIDWSKTDIHTHPHTVLFHEMRNNQEHLAHKLAIEEAQNSPPSTEKRISISAKLKGEKCQNAECCTSPCAHYLGASRGDLILWTDASFFPDSGKCAAAFGVECPEGMKITAFRVRGNSARGETLAIFGALQSCAQSDRDLAIFSDCESAIKKVQRLLLSLKTLSPSLSFSVSLSCLEKRIFSVLQQIERKGHSISLHWVKGHAGIIQNEMIDQAAKKEAQIKHRESLFEEKPEMIGDLAVRDKLVESREEICYPEWRPDLDKAVMKAARSWMAKRVMAGIEQWRGLRPSWESGAIDDCVHCHKKHKLGFEFFVRKCSSAEGFRKIVQGIWEGITWNDELLEGRVQKLQIRELCEKKCGGSREAVVREGRARVRRWEKVLVELRKEL